MESNDTHWTNDPSLLEEFVLDRVEPGRRSVLEKHLRLCSRCRVAVGHERELVAGIRLAGRQELKAKLRDQLKKEKRSPFQRYQMISLAAAILVILVGLGILRLYFGSFVWPTKFSSRHYVIRQNTFDSSSDHGSKETPPKTESDEITSSAKQAPLGNAGASSGIAATGGAEMERGVVGRDLEESESEGNRKAFWLLGTVIMKEEPSVRISAAAKAEQIDVRVKRTGEEFAGRDRVIRVRKGGASQTITLRQLPSGALAKRRDLPSSKKEAGTVRTLVEKTRKGLNLTMYRETLLGSTKFQQATIEPITDDSLIVDFSDERIAYRIPGGWSAQQSTPPTLEGR